MRAFLNHMKNETFDEIKTSLENLWQRMIQLSEFFPIPIRAYSETEVSAAGRVVLLQLLSIHNGAVGIMNLGVMVLCRSARWADERQLQLLGKAVHVYTWCDITARLTLEMGYKEISRVICAMHNIAGRHNDVPTEMAPGPILAYPIGDILLSTLPSLANGLCNDTLVLNECQAWLPRACYSQWARCKHWRLAV